MTQKAMRCLMCFSIFLSLCFLSTQSCRAEEDRVQAELKDKAPVVNPLKSALGDAEYDKAVKSGGYSYSGNLKCRLCHRDFFMGRKKDPHEHTFKPRVEAGHAEEPRCLACHTTGYGVATGFSSVKETPKLADVQCEGCHGPGSKHNELGAKGGFLAGKDHPEILKKMCQACHNARWNKSFTNLDAAYEAYRNAEAAAASK